MKTDNPYEYSYPSNRVSLINWRIVVNTAICIMAGFAFGVSLVLIFHTHTMVKEIRDSQASSTESQVTPSEASSSSDTGLTVPNMPTMERPPLDLPRVNPNPTPPSDDSGNIAGTETESLIQQYGDTIRFTDPFAADGNCDQWIYTPDFIAVYCLDDVPEGVDVTDPKVPLMDFIPPFMEDEIVEDIHSV